MIVKLHNKFPKIILLIVALLNVEPSVCQNSLELKFKDVANGLNGKLGVSTLHVETGEYISFNGKEKFPMQSVYKFPIALVMLKQIDEGEFSLNQKVKVNKSEYMPPAGHSPIRDKFPDGITLTIKELLRYNVSESDGTACDVLIRLLGGTDKVQAILSEMGVENIAIATTEMVQVSNDTIQYQNWSTPEAMNKLLEGFQKGKYITSNSKKLLEDYMSFSNSWFDSRIKGRLPAGTHVIHKTGTARTYDGLTRATNDVGIITLPDGNHLAISVFISDSYDSQKIREETIAKISKYAFDYWISKSKLRPQNWQKPSKKYNNAYKKYLNAKCPIGQDDIQHFVYFSRDRKSIINHAFLRNSVFKGAQIMYAWKDLESEKGQYDFSIIKEDIAYLKKYDKKLFVQIQDATFNPKYKAVPSYLLTNEYDGGAVFQYDDMGKPDGWVAKRWNKKVRERFALLLKALGEEFDGVIEGVNIQETSIGVNTSTDASFNEQEYVKGLKENMLALKQAFPKSTTMIYANFIPGEWLPFEDKGYLLSIYKYGESIGVGLGAPDLMVTRKGQLNHALAQMHEGRFTVPLGIAIQDGNYIGKTGADSDYDEEIDRGSQSRKNIVPLLHAFAKDFLKVNYMFWVNQEPYFNEDVLPCLTF